MARQNTKPKIVSGKPSGKSIKKDRRKNQNDTMAREEFFVSIIEYAADGIVTIDEKRIVGLFNPAAEKLFGYSAAEVVGHNIKMLMPSPFRGEHDGYVANYLETGVAKIIGTKREVEGRRKDGTTFPLELGVREFWVPGQKMRLFIGIMRDLTEVKRAQEELARKSQDILELSTPVISVGVGVLALPLIGTLDSRRTQDCMEKALTRMADQKARVLIVDITGVPTVDTMVANHLVNMASAVRLMGGQSILTGISPSTAMTIVGLGIDLSILNTRATLAQGLQLADELLGTKTGQA